MYFLPAGELLAVTERVVGLGDRQRRPRPCPEYCWKSKRPLDLLTRRQVQRTGARAASARRACRKPMSAGTPTITAERAGLAGGRGTQTGSHRGEVARLVVAGRVSPWIFFTSLPVMTSYSAPSPLVRLAEPGLRTGRRASGGRGAPAARRRRSRASDAVRRRPRAAYLYRPSPLAAWRSASGTVMSDDLGWCGVERHRGVPA